MNDFNFFADDVIKLGRPFNFRRVALDHFYILCKFQVFAIDGWPAANFYVKSH